MRKQLDFTGGAKDLIMACQMTGVYDVNRNENVQPDDYPLIKNWVESVADLGLNGVVFHNNFSNSTLQKHPNERITFIEVPHNPQYNPNVYRYFLYAEFLRKYAQNVDNLFVTDISDVVAVLNPFVQPLYVANPNSIFCGDEPKILANDWMMDHSTHLRNNMADYALYEAQYSNETLLNCGIIGGNVKVMQPFISQLWRIHEQYNSQNKTNYTGDMGAFNYLARTQFGAQLKHGAPVNTVFKAYQNDRTDCWFRHK